VYFCVCSCVTNSHLQVHTLRSRSLERPYEEEETERKRWRGGSFTAGMSDRPPKQRNKQRNKETNKEKEAEQDKEN